MLFGSRCSPVCDECGNEDDGRVSASEVKSHRHGSPSILHEFASNIVDRRNVVGIDGMPKTKGVCQEGRAEENRFIVERKNCPYPGTYVSGGQKAVNADDPVSDTAPGDFIHSASFLSSVRHSKRGLIRHSCSS